MRKTLIILFGAPGSGKGSLGDKIKEQLVNHKGMRAAEISYISTGDLLREEIAAQSELGMEISQIVNSGKLVSDEIVATLVEKALSHSDEFDSLGVRVPSQHVMLLDGYPRTETQRLALANMLQDKAMFVVAVKRNTPFDVIKKRVSERRVCKNCKTTHLASDGKCPKCGGESIIRKDDAVIEQRLVEYETNTAPVWNKLALICDAMQAFDGMDDADAVAKWIVKKYF